MAAAYSESGSFTSRSTTGIDTIPVGFAPKGVIITVTKAAWSNTAAVDGDMNNVWAITDGTTTRSCAIYDRDAADPMDTQYAYSTTILAVNGNGAATLNGAVSFTGTDIEINWTTISAAWSVSWWAIGGADVSAKVIATSKTGTGSVGVTGAGFQPKALVLMSSSNVTAANNTAAGASRMLGFVDDDADDSGLGTMAADAVGTSDTSRIMSSAASLTIRNAANSTTPVTAAVTSLDADGFTINFTALTTSPIQYAALCLGGAGIIAAEIVTLTANATVGANTQTMSGLPFQPDAGLIMGMSTVNVNSNAAAVLATFGFFSQSLNQSGMLNVGSDGTAVATNYEGASRTGALLANSLAATPWQAHGRISSIGATSIGVSWSAGKVATLFTWSALLFNLDVPTTVTGTMDAQLGALSATADGAVVTIPANTVKAGQVVCMT